MTGCAHIEINAQNPLENALETLSKALNLKGEECIVGLPDTHVFYRNLTLPFKDKKKQREVIPFELETGIAFPIEDAVMDFTPADHANAGEILVVFAQKPMIKELLDPFERLGIFPEVLTSTGFAMASRLLRQKETPQTGLLMNMAEGRLTLVLWKNRRIVLIRNVTVPGFENDNPKDGFEDAEVLHLCHMAKNTIHAFAAEHRAFSSPEKAYLDGSLGAHIQTIHKVSECLKITAEKVDLLHDPRITLSSELDNAWDSRIMNGALSLALAGHGPNAGPNLRQGEFEIHRQSFFKSRHFRKITLWLFDHRPPVGCQCGGGHLFSERAKGHSRTGNTKRIQKHLSANQPNCRSGQTGTDQNTGNAKNSLFREKTGITCPSAGSAAGNFQTGARFAES